MNMKTIIVATSLMLASLGASAANRYVVLSDSIFTQAYGTTRPSKMAFNLVNTRIDAIVHVVGSPAPRSPRRAAIWARPTCWTPSSSSAVAAA